MIIIPIFICTWQQFTGNRHRRIAEIQRNTQQLIQFFRMLVNPFYLPCLVRHANNNRSTVSVGKSYDGNSQCLWLDLNTFAVKRLVFLARYYFLYAPHKSGG